MFVGLHASAAMLLKTPELAIDETEGKHFMKAAQNVMRHYDVAANQKTLDWIAFLGCAGGIYGTRVFAISVRRQAERQNATGEERGQVLHFRRPVRPVEVAPAESVAEPVAKNAPPSYVPSVVPGGEFDADGGEGF